MYGGKINAVKAHMFMLIKEEVEVLGKELCIRIPEQGGQVYKLSKIIQSPFYHKHSINRHLHPNSQSFTIKPSHFILGDVPSYISTSHGLCVDNSCIFDLLGHFSGNSL